MARVPTAQQSTVDGVARPARRGQADTSSASSPEPLARSRIELALALGLAVLVVVLAVVLSGAPVTVAGTNDVPAGPAVAYVNGGQAFCQPAGRIPAGTDALRVSLSANVGPSVAVRVLSGSTLLAGGSRGAGWGTAESVTIPVSRLARTVEGAQVCLTLGKAIEAVQVNGAVVASPSGGRAARLRIEYLHPGSSSWLSLVGSIAGNMGVGHAPAGTWVAYLTIAIMIAIVALVTRALLRETRSGEPDRAQSLPPLPRGLRARLVRVPRVAWLCGLVAVLSAVSWSLITPPFQVPDEPAHFAYAQWLAQTGTLPTSNGGVISKEEEVTLQDLRQPEVQWHPEVHTISSQAQKQRLDADMSAHLSRVGVGDAGVAASEPPAYYALETIPYYLGSGGTLLDRLALMRLLSALMAGVTAMFTFLFVRESLPGLRWAWIAAGLAAALMPLLGFSSGAVTPDSMLIAVSVAIFYCLARGFRRGLTRGLAVTTGALTAIGLLTKLSFIGLVPGILVGLVWLTRRSGARASGREVSQADQRSATGRSLAIAAALALSPAVVYVASNLVGHHRTLGIASTAVHRMENESLLHTIAYIWQFYLPRLPGMVDYFPGVSTTRDLWFDRAVGLYGWLDTPFPGWVYDLALIPAGLIAALGARAVIARRTTLSARLPEICVYLVMSVGLLVLVGASSYSSRTVEGASYIQPRYLLPLLPLAALLLALAVRGAGRRWAPVAAVLIVVLFLGHDVFSQLQVVARYYG